jgi:hypothetical protein
VVVGAGGVVSLWGVLAATEFWPSVFSGVINRADGPTPVVAGKPTWRRRFTREENLWMAKRAGWRCECVATDCHAPEKSRHHGRDGRCLADFRQPGVQIQGDHLAAYEDRGATDPVLNGAALCAGCNQFKSGKEWPRQWLRQVAENRLNGDVWSSSGRDSRAGRGL